MKTIKVEYIHAKRMAGDPAYREAYASLDDEFVLAESRIKARACLSLAGALRAGDRAPAAYQPGAGREVKP